MRLAEVLDGQPYRCSSGTVETHVSSLTHDSRRVRPGAVFFCLPGRHFDGREFAAQALAAGAAAVVAEAEPPFLPPGATLALVPDARRSFALASAAFWGHPSARLRVLAVTGTNGKTTVNHLTEAILRADGRATGLVGTVENHLGNRAVEACLTTPDAQEIQAGLASMAAAGFTHACVEVSSHGLAGHRLAGCAVDAAVLTNVARDHLDFHQDVGSYAATKLTLFQGLGRVMGTGGGYSSKAAPKNGPAYAVLNSDDAFFDCFRQKVTAPYLAYGTVRAGHVKLSASVLGARGSLVRVAFCRRPRGLPPAEWIRPAGDWPEEGQLKFPHPGRHNVSNLLAALTLAWAEGCRWQNARRAAESFAGVRGRWEIVAGPNGVVGVVDFAHNPDGLVRALETARLVARRRVILVFGCEGQKDRGKRPVMGAIASRLADHVILTLDNTFHEAKGQILGDIEAGLRPGAGTGPGWPCGGKPPAPALLDPQRRATFEVVEDRRTAIFRAAALAESGDLVMVAGRGHDVKLVFGSRTELLDDREVLREAIAAAYLARKVEKAGPAAPDDLILTPTR